MDPLENVKQQWAADCIIDDEKLDQESLKIPSLHAKYMDFYSKYNLILADNKSKLKIILRDKWIYYNGKASPETYKENPFDLKILTQVLRIEYFETVINYIDGILRQINSRTYHIKNALEHRRFEAGF